MSYPISFTSFPGKLRDKSHPDGGLTVVAHDIYELAAIVEEHQQRIGDYNADTKALGPKLAGGVFTGGDKGRAYRSGDNVVSIQLLFLDVDGISNEQYQQVIDKLNNSGLELLWHHTGGDKPETRRIRIWVPLARPIDPHTEDYKEFYQRTARALALGQYDSATSSASNWSYMNYPHGVDKTVHIIKGALLEPQTKPLASPITRTVGQGSSANTLRQFKRSEQDPRMVRFKNALTLFHGPAIYLNGELPSVASARAKIKDMLDNCEMADNAALRLPGKDGVNESLVSLTMVVFNRFGDNANSVQALHDWLTITHRVATLKKLPSPNSDSSALDRAIEAARVNLENNSALVSQDAPINDEKLNADEYDFAQLPVFLKRRTIEMFAPLQAQPFVPGISLVVPSPLTLEVWRDKEVAISETTEHTTQIAKLVNKIPTLFFRNGLLNLAVFNPDIELKTLTKADIAVLMDSLEYLTLRTHSILHTPRGMVPTLVPVEPVFADIPSMLELFKHLTQISAVPVLNADLSLHTQGYNPNTKTYVYLTKQYPELPSVERAVELIMGPHIETPFQEEHHKAVHLAHVLTYHAAALLNGQRSPLFLYNATKAGSGKSTLCTQARLLATADINLAQSGNSVYASDNDEEFRKTLVADSDLGREYFYADNVETGKHFGGPTLQSAITESSINVRRLGVNQTVKIELSRSVWAMNGNNLTWQTDLSRRLAIVNLQPLDEQLSTKARAIKDIDSLFETTQPAATMGAIAILKAYMEAGAPGKKPTYASFQRWSDVVLGAACWALGQDIEAVSEAMQLDREANNDDTERQRALWQVMMYCLRIKGGVVSAGDIEQEKAELDQIMGRPNEDQSEIREYFSIAGFPRVGTTADKVGKIVGRYVGRSHNGLFLLKGRIKDKRFYFLSPNPHATDFSSDDLKLLTKIDE